MLQHSQKTKAILCGLSLTVFIQLAAHGAEPSRWPSFLGVGRNDCREEAAPTRWDASTNILWKSPLKGYGQSSPVVWDGNVFVTCIDGPMKDIVRVQSFNLKSGDELWTYEGRTENLVENNDYHSRSSMTPVVDAQGIIAGFECGLVVALDPQGAIRWQKDLFKEYGEIASNHGIASSLAQNDQTVFVWIPRRDEPFVIALDKKTGDVAWKKDLPTGVTWGSPVMLPIHGGYEHIVFSCTGTGEESGVLCGLDPIDGEILWKVEGLAGNTTQSPQVVGPNELLIGASSGREGGPAKQSIATNGLVRVESSDDGYQADYVWRSTKATSGFCSPCVHRGLVYFTDRRGIVTCMNIQDGSEVYTERLGGSVWATPLGVGSYVYFVGEVGTTHVLEAGPSPKVLSKNVLWEDDPDAKYAPPPSRDATGEESSAQVEIQTEIPSTKPRQYAVLYVDNILIIRRGDVLYAIANANP